MCLGAPSVGKPKNVPMYLVTQVLKTFGNQYNMFTFLNVFPVRIDCTSGFISKVYVSGENGFAYWCLAKNLI